MEIYRIQLPQFEGPFDLLLFFIERDEIDIYDIPIAKVTLDFLAYLHQMEFLNMEIAAEFILVAGTLMRIKSKMLLPRPEINEKGEEVDPRDELVRRLLEYKKFKAVLTELEEMESEQTARIVRGAVKMEEKYIAKANSPIEELSSLDVYSLMKTFKRIWDQHQNELRNPRHVIQKYPYSMEEVRASWREKVEKVERLDFIEFISENPNRIYVVFSFLAMLELVQERVLRVFVSGDYNQFWVSKREAANGELKT